MRVHKLCTHLNPVLGGERLGLGGVNRGDPDHALERAGGLFPVRLEVLAVAWSPAAKESSLRRGAGGMGVGERCCGDVLLTLRDCAAGLEESRLSAEGGGTWALQSLCRVWAVWIPGEAPGRDAVCGAVSTAGKQHTPFAFVNLLRLPPHTHTSRCPRLHADCKIRWSTPTASVAAPQLPP